ARRWRGAVQLVAPECAGAGNRTGRRRRRTARAAGTAHGNRQPDRSAATAPQRTGQRRVPAATAGTDSAGGPTYRTHRRHAGRCGSAALMPRAAPAIRCLALAASLAALACSPALLAREQLYGALDDSALLDCETQYWSGQVNAA